MRQRSRFCILYMMCIYCAVSMVAPQGTVFAAASVPPSPGAIRVDNRLAGSQDLVTVTGLHPGDAVKVYADNASASPIGSTVVGSGSSAASVSVSSLGTDSGYVYVTVTEPSYSESRRIVKSFSAEPLSVAPAPSSIRVVNHPGGTSDQVIVQGMDAGEVVKVYSDAHMTHLLGTAAAQGSSEEGTVVAVGQLGAGEGIVYVTLTKPGQRESRAAKKAYNGEAQTPKPLLEQIRIVNELNGTSDHVQVHGLHEGDTVKIYASERAAATAAQAVVPSGSDSADAALPQLGIGEGAVFITVTSPGMQESGRVSKRFRTEPATTAPGPGMIKVTNETEGTADRIELYGTSAGDLVKVYSTAASVDVLGSAVTGVASQKALVSVPQLGKQAGSVFITVTSPSFGESLRVEKTFAAELASQAPERADVLIHNAAGSADTVTVFGLDSGDLVKVYTDEASTVPLGSSTAGQGSAIVPVRLPGTGYGVVYVTVTRGQEEESAKISKVYAAEPVTLPLSPSQIRIVNTTDADNGDEVSITNLNPNDTVKVYADAKALVPLQTMTGSEASAAVGAGETVATLQRLRLDSAGGTVFVTVTSENRRESSRTFKVYDPE